MEDYKIVENKLSTKKVMNINELCDAYEIGRHAAYNLAHRKDAPVIKNGRKFLFIRSKVDDFMESLIGKQI
ncbi:helix-turn-helix domain-containing protein [Clostridium tyrobutyricum]|uniref:helix-turn-helix domain-containing protein n=1 Tax=Clostridium tyrobutyricum TaxID=1519 RepID=UPI00057EA8BE|nr:helix-turn-helix domain-containing protein [Clostridium tyrobutyricum]